MIENIALKINETARVPIGLKFLDAYEKKDIDIYFGREDAIHNLYDKVAKNNLTVVYGLSGTGKTSLIQCGLANEFSDSDWLELLVRKKRSSTINECTFEAIHNAAKTTIRPPSGDQINTTFLLKCLDTLYKDYFSTIYLIYDQFEELFILGSENEKFDFFSFLKACTSSTLNIKVILIIREEYIGSLYDFESRDFRLMSNCFRVQPMSQLEIIENVLKNIFKKNGIVEFERWTNVRYTRMLGPSENELTHSSEKITETYADKEPTTVLNLIYNKIKDANTRLVELPNMQVYLDKLIRKLPPKKQKLTVEDVISIGKLDDILTSFLEETVNSIAQGHDCTPEDIWNILNCLVSVKDTKQGLRLEEITKAISIYQ
jgi:hypothetical protein